MSAQLVPAFDETLLWPAQGEHAPRWGNRAEPSISAGLPKLHRRIAGAAGGFAARPGGNVVGFRALRCMSQLETIARPVARALSIYRKVARHNPGTQARRGLARHIKNLVDQGVRDPGRLTVYGLSYLRDQDQG